MELGLLPALGGSIAELRRSGQHSRLIDGYLRRYAAAFGRVWFFSYASEMFADYTDDPALLDTVSVLAASRALPRGLRALTIPLVHADVLRGCGVVRVFQITGVIPALIANRRWGTPYVTTYGFSYAQLSQPGPKRVLKGFVERLGLKRAAAVIATTDELRARAARFNPRVELIPNGVDTRLFAPRSAPRPRRAGNPARVLYVGRLAPEKNLKTIITATKYLGDRAMDVMVGSGPLRDQLTIHARAQGVVVEFPGVVEQLRLPEVYGASDVFVLASFTEGHPKVLLEAMSCGLPCVASNCAGNRSLITHEETGLLFDSHDPKALAGCLERVLSDAALAERLGRAAREMIVARYDLRALVGREIELLRLLYSRR